jgi:hypothetical protein
LGPKQDTLAVKSRASSTHCRIRNAYKILIAKDEGKILLERPRRRGEDDIMNIKEVKV